MTVPFPSPTKLQGLVPSLLYKKGNKAIFSLLYKFSPRFLYFAFLNIHCWLNIANITPDGPDDGSVEPKRYSVDFSINLSFHLYYLVINFSTQSIIIHQSGSLYLKTQKIIWMCSFLKKEALIKSSTWKIIMHCNIPLFYLLVMLHFYFYT